MDELNDLFDSDLNLDESLDNNIISAEQDNLDDNFLDDAEPSNKKPTSLLTELLKARGIENNEILVIDENNEEQKVNFNDLSLEEQLEILNSHESPEDNDLDDSEIDLINHLRENNLSVDDFLANYKQSILAEVNEQGNQNYDIDNYDDQELFLLDLKNKYDLTDEELVKELEKELQDEVLFKKKVDILRTEYKQLEEEYNQNQQLETERQREEEYDQFSDAMVNVALTTPEFYGIELEDDEKNEVLSFLLDLDDNGTSEFYKTLNDPKKLYEAAWFLRYGKESFDALKNAYESEIARLKKPDRPKTIISKETNNNQNSIHDLF